jgi:diaminopropionate ammonia-lyase
MFLANSVRAIVRPPRPHLRAALGARGRRRVEAFLPAWGDRHPTPLLALPALAATVGVGAIHIKDEGQRLGLQSFKALGGADAVLSLLLDAGARRLGRDLAPAEIASSEMREIAAAITVACATDGNHGRSVAAGARLAGCRAVVFVHAGVSPSRAAAIAAFGAEIVRVAGDYDDSVAAAAATAAREGWIVVSDTSWDGYEDIPLTVMQGYSVMAGEALDALPVPPSHLFLQAGVGGMAAAVAAYFAEVLGPAAPKVAVVEPERAACLFASAEAGRLVTVPHNQPTVMAMLDCRTPSLLAWEILASLADGFVTLAEDQAIDAMKRLAAPLAGDPPIVAGESGGAGLAGFFACLSDPDARAALGLDRESRILLFNTEGATDPALYAGIVGRNPEEVAGRLASAAQS